MSQPIYLTTTLPYVNADPHLGFAWEAVAADVLARYYRVLGREVFFNTGTDEHGWKIYRQALTAGQDPQSFVNEKAAKFERLKTALNLTYDNFIRTTDPAHAAAAREFWRRCDAAGDIYKKKYQVKYCVGCELEKTESELVGGRCPLHPNAELEIIEEENYFFKFSRYQARLLDLYDRQPDFVVPSSRLNEIKKFVARGLEDFSISRLKTKMPWGVPVPNDSEQVMYVWFDALINYISTLGWPAELEKFEKFWGAEDSPNAIQLAGKDNLRQQAAMWPAMLMSAGLPTPKQIVIHGFITSGGQKMSKSLGNVIDPFQLVADYGTDAVRYYLLRHVHPFEDSDFTLEKFKEAYNANLANGLGNLVSRVMKMASANNARIETNGANRQRAISDYPDLTRRLSRYEFNQALDLIWQHIALHDEYIQKTKPFTLIKTAPEEARGIIAKLVGGLRDLAVCLAPFLPATAEKIQTAVQTNRLPEPLFPRK